MNFTRSSRRRQPLAEGHHSCAFTLIELLVVISIISLLIAVLLPALSAARDSARTMQGLSNHRMMTIGVLYYANDYGQHLPYGERQWTSDWSQLVSGYIGQHEMAWTSGVKISPIFQDPNATVPAGKIHYAAHPKLMPAVNPTNPDPLKRRTFRIDDLRRPVENMLIADTGQDPNPNSAYYGNAEATVWGIDTGAVTWKRFNPATADNPVPRGPDTDSTIGRRQIRWRQAGGDGANFSFLDGHAATMRVGALLERHVFLERFPTDP